MKKFLLIIISVGILLLFWYIESRKFICLNDGQCITVWKTYNNTCYIMPGKYYGLFSPKSGYLKTSCNNNLSLFFVKELPNEIIYRSEQSVDVFNGKKDDKFFVDYGINSSKFEISLYKKDSKKNNDLRDKVEMIELFLEDNFALDKEGNKL